jgi:undecaprenyl-diphosphatase
MIDSLEALVLGVVQGATEYLPVSSSGHLVIAQHLLGFTEPALLFDIVLHLGTLVAVVWYYRHDLQGLVRHSLLGLRELLAGGSATVVQAKYPCSRLAVLIVIGTIPTAVIGLTFEEAFESLFVSVRATGTMLMVTGLILVSSRLAPSDGRGIGQMRVLDALLIGLAQGLAITPGISRSGATIATALLLGIERETAARYSFLLSIPSIVGALLLELGDSGSDVAFPSLGVGFLAALVTGYACLTLLVYLVKRGRLAWFAPYCIALGLLAVVLA